MTDSLLDRLLEEFENLVWDRDSTSDRCNEVRKQIQEKIEKWDKINELGDNAFSKLLQQNKALTEQVKDLKEELEIIYLKDSPKLREQIKQLQEERSKALALLSSASRESVLLQIERDELKSKIENITKDKELYKTVVLHLQKEIFDIETQGWKKSEIAEEILKTLHKILNSTKSTDSTEILGEEK